MNKAVSPPSEIEPGDDLPPELQKAIAPRKRRQPSKYKPTILRLLGQYGPLNLNQLLVGMYRAQNKVMTRKQMTAHIRDLKKAGLVESEAWGIYALSVKGEEKYDNACGGGR